MRAMEDEKIREKVEVQRSAIDEIILFKVISLT